MIGILEHILETQVVESDFVFTTTGKAPISGFGKAKIMLMALMSRPWLSVVDLKKIAPDYVEQKKIIDIPRFTTHDLRRSYATRLEKVSSPFIARKIIGHAMGKLERTYLKEDYLEERRIALEKHSEAIKGIVGEWARWP
jgi:integrase